jgi:hypothetical protein
MHLREKDQVGGQDGLLRVCRGYLPDTQLHFLRHSSKKAYESC